MVMFLLYPYILIPSRIDHANKIIETYGEYETNGKKGTVHKLIPLLEYRKHRFSSEMWLEDVNISRGTLWRIEVKDIDQHMLNMYMGWVPQDASPDE